MSQSSGSPKTFVAGEALEAFRRIKLSGTSIVYADDEEKADGVTLEAAKAVGDLVACALINAGGTIKMTASDAIAAGADYYAAADGKIESAGTISYGKTIGSSTAAGDIIEVLPN